MTATSEKWKTLFTPPLLQRRFLGQRPGNSWRSQLKSWFFYASLMLLVWFLLSWMSGENIPYKTICQWDASVEDLLCRYTQPAHALCTTKYSLSTWSPSFRAAFWAEVMAISTFWETIVIYSLNKTWKSHQTQSSSPGFRRLRCAWEAP